MATETAYRAWQKWQREIVVIAGLDLAIHHFGKCFLRRLMDARVEPVHDVSLDQRNLLPSGFRIFTSSACTNSLPQITCPVFSGSSSPSMP